MGGEPHFTLRPIFNLLLIVLLGSMLVGMGIFYRPIPMLLIVIGSIAGIVVGVLQKRSLEKNIQNFIQASTALNVRQVLASSKEGRLALVLQWGAVAAMVIIALLQHSPNFNVVWDMIFGYIIFMFCRELITFLSTLKIAQSRTE